MNLPLVIRPSTHFNIFKRARFRGWADTIFHNNIVNCYITLIACSTNTLKYNLFRKWTVTVAIFLPTLCGHKAYSHIASYSYADSWRTPKNVCVGGYMTSNNKTVCHQDCPRKQPCKAYCIYYVLINFRYFTFLFFFLVHFFFLVGLKYKAITCVFISLVNLTTTPNCSSSFAIKTLMQFFFTWTTCKIRHHVFTTFDAHIRNVKCKNNNVIEVLKSSKYISPFEPRQSTKFSCKMHRNSLRVRQCHVSQHGVFYFTWSRATTARGTRK